MYALIVAIHGVFVALSYMLGYTVLSGVFIFFGIFFLFYFSPLFFLDNQDAKSGGLNFSLETITSLFSLKKSLLLPLALLYIALYGFLFSLFGSRETFLFLHGIVIFGIYTLFFGYALGFDWKTDIFFEAFRFHTLFTLIGTLLFTLSVGVEGGDYSSLHILLGCVGVASGTLLLSQSQDEGPIFLYSYLLGIFSTVLIVVFSFFGEMDYFSVSILLSLVALGIFELFPKSYIFSPYTHTIQYFSLSVVIILSFSLLFFLTRGFTLFEIGISILVTFFFFSVHTRYTNYITYILGLLGIFFLYQLLFFSLLGSGSPFSSFLFLFFLPFLLIGSTYFWEEKYEYDFIILHYSSILFSVIYSIYTIFFVGWGSDILFMISLSIFGIALLLFLSYFRFRLEKKSPSSLL